MNSPSTIPEAQSTERLLRWNGFYFATCSVLVTAGYMLHPPNADHMHSGRWEATHALLLVPLAMFPLLLTGLWVPRMVAAGRRGLIGYVLSVLGLVFVFGLDYIETFLNPVLAAEEPGWVARHGAGEMVGAIALVFPLSALAFGIGTVLLFTALFRADDLPRPALWISILGVFPMLAGAYMPATLIGYAGPLVFGVGMVWVGLALWGERKALPIGACVGMAILSAGLFFATEANPDREKHEMIAAMHAATVEVPEENAPTIELIVVPDMMHGFNVELRTTQFRFAPEKVGMPHVSGEGHAHLAIDGFPHTRLYSESWYLPHLAPGEHEISVSLNANNHATLTLAQEPIVAHATVVVPE